MNVCKFKVLEILLNIFRLISFKFGSGRGPPLGVLVCSKIWPFSLKNQVFAGIEQQKQYQKGKK